jgi:GrpB-like predicted nucleotidyltransferase (UPF0157 family)
VERTGLPFVPSFVIGRDGKILDGTPLEQAFEEIDGICTRRPLGYMVNCSHPSFLHPEKRSKAFFERLIGYQANASALDHDRLDEAPDLHAGELKDWGDRMLALNRRFGVRILGGCCGTGAEHLRYLVRDAGNPARPRAAETLEEKVARVTAEEVEIADYDPAWKARFEEERDFLRSILPEDLVKRIEHFGSTAVPGLCAKPIVDLLVEVKSLEETKTRIAPLLEARGYDYFWRPTFGDDTPPFYAWFIKRDAGGTRTHHIHMVEADFEHWERLRFRDHLISHPGDAEAYAALKRRLQREHGRDRIAYTEAKSAFIGRIMEKIRRADGEEPEKEEA